MGKKCKWCGKYTDEYSGYCSPKCRHDHKPVLDTEREAEINLEAYEAEQKRKWERERKKKLNALMDKIENGTVYKKDLEWLYSDMSFRMEGIVNSLPPQNKNIPKIKKFLLKKREEFDEREEQKEKEKEEVEKAKKEKEKKYFKGVLFTYIGIQITCIMLWGVLSFYRDLFWWFIFPVGFFSALIIGELFPKKNNKSSKRDDGMSSKERDEFVEHGCFGCIIFLILFGIVCLFLSSMKYLFFE